MFIDLEMEMCVINACIQINTNLEKIIDIIHYDDFSHKHLQQIFLFLLENNRQNKSVDEKILKTRFSNINEHFWNSLFYSNWSCDVLTYAQFLHDLSTKRKLNEILQSSIIELKNIDKPLEFITSLNSSLYELNNIKGGTIFKNTLRMINEFYEELNRINKLSDKNIIGINTGFPKLNKYTKGFKSGELIILAARTGVGKTTFATNILFNVLQNNIGVVFYSLETEAFKITAKLISQKTQIDLETISTGAGLSKENIELLEEAASHFKNKNLFVYDNGNLNIDTIRTSLRKLKEDNPNIGLCIIDYIQLINSSNAKADRYIQVGEISRGLKLLAMELKIPILALSQVNRLVDSRTNKKLFLSDLRESGNIEQDADIVLFINKSNETKEGFERPVYIDIAKNRNGDISEILFDFKASKSIFIEK